MTTKAFALPPQYDPHVVEGPLYQRWLDARVFSAHAESAKRPYVIVIPPPNVTAVLHMGQGLNVVTQDVLIRFERMRGREALWLPGTDHAGIATQNVVERLIAKEGKTRFDLGRAAYVEGGPAPFLTVATTRPETLLGDTAVAVHPQDARYAGFVGKTARVPIIDLPVPILADDAVVPSFGTGAVKVTPAHDANDFEIGQRHKLEMPLVMTEDGRMQHPTRVPKSLADLDRFAARERIVDLLKERGQLEKIEPYQHAVRHCYRCDSVVEPRLSDQWFVKMKPLAEPAVRAYHAGEIRLVPERWGATYEHWLANIRDWNISRQLWWGHRVPVFTCTKCGERWADRQDPKRCRTCGGPVEQDPAVLAPGFSSGLWPLPRSGGRSARRTWRAST